MSSAPAGSPADRERLKAMLARRAAPLSYAQERLWLLHRAGAGAAYNIPAVLPVPGDLDPGILEACLKTVVRRHASLRTRFVEVDGQPLQVVTSGSRIPLETVDPGEGETGFEAAVAEAARRESSHIFDLEKDPLLRATLVRSPPSRGALILNVHHIVSDGWSMGVLLGELQTLYEAYAAGRPDPLPELPLQYADHARAQRAALEAGRLDELTRHWRTVLAGTEPVLDLAGTRPRPRQQSFAGALQGFTAPDDVARALRHLADGAGATRFMVLLAVFQVLLQRYSARDHFLVGTPIASRDRVELEGLIGFFVNVLVLRADCSGDPTFRSLLHRVRDTVLDAYEHQDMPFERLVGELAPARTPAHPPLVQVTFELQNAPTMAGLQQAGVLRRADRPAGGAPVPSVAKYELSVAFAEAGGGLRGSFEYATALFEHRVVERMIRHYRSLLAAAARTPDRRIRSLPLVDEDERRALVRGWTTEDPLPEAVPSLPDLVLEAAARHPGRAAVGDRETSLSYEELDRRSAALALHLRQTGVGRETPVPLVMERTPALLVAILGVLRAGGAFVPLEPSDPPLRLASVLRELDAPVVLTGDSVVLPPGGATGGAVLPEARFPLSGGTSVPLAPTPAEGLAYVMFTSGSTGRPKGVMVAHRALARYLTWSVRAYGMDDPETGDAVVATSPAFDLTLTGLLGPLTVGGTVRLVDPRTTPDRLGRQVARHRGAALLKLTPTHLRLLGEQVPPTSRRGLARCIVVGGEPLDRDLAAAWTGVDPHLRLVNEYGPTEATVGCSFHVADVDGPGRPGEPVPIGRAAPGVRLLVLDETMAPVPVGLPGELYVGGAQLARGYHGRPRETAAAFVPDPFGGTPGGRLYRTGDRVRLREDGELEFGGRVDEQLKIRGYRIEPREVALALEHHPGVRTAVVVAREKEGSPSLVAYLVRVRAGDTSPPDGVALRDFAAARLPRPMIPDAFVWIDTLPLTGNGKLDRSALPPPESGTRREPSPPVGETEWWVAGLWEDLTGATGVGREDRFFVLGGHSLLATRALARLRREFGVSLSFEEILGSDSVRSVAALVEARRAVQGSAAVADAPIPRLPRERHRAGSAPPEAT